MQVFAGFLAVVSNAGQYAANFIADGYGLNCRLLQCQTGFTNAGFGIED